MCETDDQIERELNSRRREIEELLHLLEQGTARANAALDAAEAELGRTLDYFATKRARAEPDRG